MKGTFTGVASAFGSVEDGGISYVRGGKNKVGLLTLNFGTGTVNLDVSMDGGSNWVTVDTYTADAAEKVQLPDIKAIYTLDCTVHSANIDYTLSGS